MTESHAAPARFNAIELWMRVALYALALALVAVAVLLARVDLKPAAVLPTPEAAATEPSSAPLALAVPTLAPPAESGVLIRFADVHTLIPSRPRYEIVKYTVVKYDTTFVVASKFNVKPETVIWGNPTLADDPNAMFPGQMLNILPVDGALRVVQPGDTLEKIAKVFHGKVEDIVNFPGNDLDVTDPQIHEGQALIIPNGWRDVLLWQLPVVSRQTTSGLRDANACPGPFAAGFTGTYSFVWPAGNHFLSGNDFIPKIHPGIDIAAGMGAAIYASDTGVVVYAGWSNVGYGNLIILDHGNGWQTAYAHLSQINVACGQGVLQGSLIGLAGSTGHSTGPHLHFEMRNDKYGRVNPWQYLP
jgi:LysM repeat protein